MTAVNEELFSIVIPNYRRVIELGRAIDSIRNQNGYNDLVKHIIIVDDKSENISTIEELVASYGDAKLVLVKNEFKSNAAATRNQGARLATTPWVCFLDSDDSFCQNKLELLKARVISDADVYYNSANVYFNDMIEKVVPHRALNKNEHVSDYLFVDGEYMQTSMLTIKRSFFDGHGFNEKYIRHQDYDLCLTFQELNLRIEFVDHVGTNIFWNSKERPNSKGESFQYSYMWLQENRERITKKAFESFYFEFIVLKSARNGCKYFSLLKFFSMKKRNIDLKKVVKYIAVLVIPTPLQFWAYVKYKMMKVRNAQRRSNSNLKK
ncbi:glycosyltransferase family 2 protein [Klebsiella quasipneumoniae]|jgi:amylovoran biosynthesis glycosyltransferase AmsB|uniref:glycosyltransferase family 2 protein n=1 Tax=Klebsiella quasipneumoniae TaxID=1463165 RepID=UPI0020C25758|nr:glycosyltransferase family A protein [Klebsiella quasipneumoniae]HCI6428803.1 glycosyltransferase family 2 protein [Klebsiella quasipneumoniae subsp. similipneumoniae]MCP6737703.1 glycosyltransferase family 2 protein [Klebsiella quasipneumoniae]MCP6746334.1 glycosyltransferase family 2 protein [Klebsiella quasipneumoniae]MDS0454892.1 glycosyltransferase family 2 protein [Klebsiella quasipneumoniae]MDS0481766.1 glycosyltransferase family 2 protein [Klebsiella quasipneumoniae]